MKKTLCGLTLLASTQPVLALDIGLGVGPCDIQGALLACDDGGWVAHVYARHAFYERNGFSVGVEYHHLSRPEASDLNQSRGTGALDYGGIYVEYSFTRSK